jgi:acetylornithine deacetylase
MKGGLASFVVALEALHRMGVRLRGNVVFCANTDEESSGAGSWACVSHGVAADAGLCAEPSGFDAWVACRGSTAAVLKVQGRTGHVDLPPVDWRDGGAVNSIERMLPLVESMRRLREEWMSRADQQHPLLSPGGIVPTMVNGGSWM